MTPVSKKLPTNDIEEFAKMRAATLLSHVASEKWMWSEKTWEVVLALIRNEGQYAREAGVCSLLIYQKYIDIAAEHLLRFFYFERALELVTLVHEDVERLQLHIRCMKRADLTPAEADILEAAIRKIGSTVDVITGMYADGPP